MGGARATAAIFWDTPHPPTRLDRDLDHTVGGMVVDRARVALQTALPYPNMAATMHIERWMTSVWAGLTAVVLTVAGGGCSGSKGGATCEGKERCACYANLTCNTGLTCLSDLCVSTTGGPGGGPGAGGDMAISGGGGIGQGGSQAVGSGGMVTGLGGATAGAGGAASGSGGATVGAGGAGGGGACTTGAERCACYPNQTCNTGLTCLASICTAAASGSGGAAGAGVGGATGSGGATGGPNLLKNGDFSLMSEYWELTSNTPGTLYYSDSTGEYCVANMSSDSYLSFSLGNPPTPSDAFAIEPGASYTLSYRAIATAASIEVKIGHAVTPYTPVYSSTDTPSLAGYQTYTHQVSSALGDTGAGLVFNGTLLYYGEVCFDDVMFFKN